MIPRGYQQIGAAFLRTRSAAILGDQVGLGKTFTAWLAIEALLGGQQGQVLLICPKPLKAQWVTELCKYNGLRQPHEVGQGWIRIDGIVIWLSHFRQFINSSRVRAQFEAIVWDVLVIDEVHKIANPQTQRTKNIKRLRARYKFGLTGTPVADKPDSLWSLINWLHPEPFSPDFIKANDLSPAVSRLFVSTRAAEYQFYNRYTRRVMTKAGKEVTRVRPEALGELQRLLRPLLMVRRLEDVGFELPEQSIIDVPLELSGDQRRLYQEIKHSAIVSIEAELEAMTDGVWDLTRLAQYTTLYIPNLLARFTRLHQVASDPTQLDVGANIKQNAKLEWFREYLDGGGSPAVMLTRYRATVSLIIRELVARDLPYCTVDTADQLTSETFIVGTWQSLGTGLNLQAVNTQILWDMIYSRLEYEQGLGRTHRQGQTRPVLVYRLIATQSVDEQVAAAIDHKQEQAEMVLAWLRANYEGNKHVDR